jgi:hypothetical protein
VASHDPLIIQVASGGAVERQMRTDPPPSVADGAAVLDVAPPGAGGRLEPPAAGEVVLTVPSPETLAREPAELRRVIDGAGPGVEPLVVVVEAAEELREDELAAVVDAARRARRSVILRIAADA